MRTVLTVGIGMAMDHDLPNSDNVRLFVDKIRNFVIFVSMPTDGADFGRTRPCYGKAYTMARDGADDSDVAQCVIRGVELDIRRDGGAPAFSVAVNAMLLATGGGDNGQHLLANADAIRRTFVDSPLTRHIVAAMETVGLSAIAEGVHFSRQQAAEKLIVHIAKSRCCDGMIGYVARNRTKSVAASHAIVESIKSKLGEASSTSDLAARMLNCSPKGLPAREAKIAPVTYSAEGLNNDEL